MKRGLLRILAEQLAQARDLHVDRAVEALELAAARELHQLVARHRLARVLRQHLEQRELAGGERHGLAVARERARGEVERERAERDRLRLARWARPGVSARRLAAQHRVDARHQLARVEGLGEVVVGAHLEADDAVDVVALAR